VDLDYNYVGHVERERMLEDRPRVEEAVAEVARRRGYAVQKSADAFAGRKLYLRYRSVLGQPERIEVESPGSRREPCGNPVSWNGPKSASSA
jgi:sRNA-binding protein